MELTKWCTRVHSKGLERMLALTTMCTLCCSMQMFVSPSWVLRSLIMQWYVLGTFVLIWMIMYTVWLTILTAVQTTRRLDGITQMEHSSPPMRVEWHFIPPKVRARCDWIVGLDKEAPRMQEFTTVNCQMQVEWLSFAMLEYIIAHLVRKWLWPQLPHAA